VVSLLGIGLLSGVADGVTSKSTDYQFEETLIGSGGLVPSISNDYQTALSVGQPIVGNSSSNNFQFEAGAQTTANPTLSIDIINSSLNFGSFSPSTTATTTSQFSVIDYTSYGYAVQIDGSSPTYSTHTISAMSTTNPSSPGTEQFGINLVDNTNFCGSGCNLGANPNYGPFSVGSAAANYNTPNEFRYVSGDEIAYAPKSSGITTYTISYIVNVASLTPSGQYTSGLSLICTATY
jgi:hypothetical protein